MKKKWNYLCLILAISVSFLAGCSKEPIEKQKETVEGSGLTYTFQLPKYWKKQENFTEQYGKQAVFGAQDGKSNSGMFVLIFPKKDVEKKEFGKRTQSELANRNGYKKAEDVYMKEYTVNKQKAFKFTFETTVASKRSWAHFYCLFTENGVIQFMFYSANDTSYKDRVKLIDASVETVKQTAYDAEVAAKEAEKEHGQEITLEKKDHYRVMITGLGKMSGDDEKELVMLRYTLTNQDKDVIQPASWEESIQIKQGSQLLKPASIPKKNTSYEVEELVRNGMSNLEPNQTIEGVLLYELSGKESLQLQLNEGIDSKEQVYTLLVP